MNTTSSSVGSLSLTVAACLLAIFITNRVQAQNTATGTNALISVTPSGNNGVNNTADGANALEYDTLGSLNTATGYNSLSHNVNTQYNVADGAYSLYYNKGSGNVGIGAYTLELNGTANENVAIGHVSLYSNATGSYNVAAGGYSLYSNTAGYLNIATGYQALYFNTTGYGNSAAGGLSLYSNTTGLANTAAGAYSLYGNTTGYLNTAAGYQALYFNTTGFNNIATGENAGLNLTTGSNNIEIGDYNPKTNTADDVAGESNTIRIGEAATQTAAYIAGIYGSVSTSSSATLVYIDNTGRLVTTSTAPVNLPAGSITSVDLAPASVTGTQLAGNLVLGGTTTGLFTGSFVGNGSGLTGVSVPASSVTGTISGSQLAAASVTGTQIAPNIALTGNTTIANEISLPATDSTGTDGVLNIGGSPFLSAYGTHDAFVGGAGNFSMSGSSNTGIGYQALFSNATGVNNMAAGYEAGANLTTGSNNIDIGDFNPNTLVADDVAGESNTIRLGEASTQTAAYIAGIYGGASTSSSATLVYVDPAGHMVTSSTANVTLGGTTTGIFAGSFNGSGAGLTGVTIPASAVTGTIAGGQIAAASVTGTQLAGNLALAGTTTGVFNGSFSGNGSGLTGVGVAALASNVAAGATAGGNLTVAGTLFSDQYGPQEFGISNKAPGYISFPVAMIYPSTANSIEAFDLMPNGTPVLSASSPDYGQVSWMDVCDGDCSADVTGTGVSFNSAHVGINGYYGYVDLGSYDYGGHSRLDLSLTLDGYQKITIAGSTSYILFNPYGTRSLFEAVYPDEFVLGSTNTQIALDNGGAGSNPRLLTMNGPNTDNPPLTLRADSTTFSGGSGTSGVNTVSIWNSGGGNANGLVITTATSTGATLLGETTGTGVGTQYLNLGILYSGTQYNLISMQGGQPLAMRCQPGTNPLYLYDTSANVIFRLTNQGQIILRPNSGTDTVEINSQGTSFFNGGNVAVGSASTTYTLGVTGTVGVSGAIAANTAQTSVAASTSGTATFSEPFQGASYKKVVIYLASVNGTANYVFPAAFAHTPVVLATSGLATSTVTTLTSNNVTVTGASSTGFLFIEGY